jgi:dTDP-4-amino-4,6-dideoxygalactose transaminase
MITPRTTGIIGVHLWGRGCDVEALESIARRHHLKLLFDAAHALACSWKGRMIGSFGDAEVLSFHATKFFNTLEGGAVVTNNDDLAQKIRLMQNFGFDGYDSVVYIGTNGKMDEMSAAMGLTSLESLDEFIATNYRNYKHYQEELHGIPGITPIIYDEAERCNYQYIVMEVDEAVTGISRDDLIKILWAENVIARRYFYPGCHRMEPYRSYFPHAGLLLPETERLASQMLSVPTGTAVTLEDITAICQIIRLAVENSATLEERLRATAPP